MLSTSPAVIGSPVSWNVSIPDGRTIELLMGAQDGLSTDVAAWLRFRPARGVHVSGDVFRTLSHDAAVSSVRVQPRRPASWAWVAPRRPKNRACRVVGSLT